MRNLGLILGGGLCLVACAGGPKISRDIPRGALAHQSFPSSYEQAPYEAYRLGPLDTISVAVFDEPDLSTKEPIPVDASGNVSLPLVGLVKAVGKTTIELSDDIAARLGEKYLVNPKVAVTVIQSVSQKVTVQGEVTEPGVYEIKGPTTLLEALSLAKGETKVASLREVVLFRTVNGKRFGGVFDVASIRRGGAPDPAVHSNDIIIVGLSRAKSVWRDILTATPVLNVLRPIAY